MRAGRLAGAGWPSRAALAAIVVALAVAAPADLRAATPTIEPPTAVLSIDGEGPFAGEGASYCLVIDGTTMCADTGLPRAAPRSIDGGDPLRLALQDGWLIDAWDARYLPYRDAGRPQGPARRLDRGRALDGDGRADIEFEGPPAGDWRLEVFVRFHDPDTAGDRTFHWRLSTPPDTNETLLIGSAGHGSLLLALAFGIPGLFGATSWVLGRRLRRRALP